MSKTINSLSIIIPCFDEEKTIARILEKVISADSLNLEKEIIVVDDGSKDKSREIIQSFQKKHPYVDIKLFCHHENQGKGSSIKTALSHATGDVILIQDADLEYSPSDFPALLSPIINNESHIVYGSRKTSHLNKPSWSFAARFIFTGMVNFLYGSKLTDLNTCYKVFKKEVLEKVELSSKRFGFCSEITAKVLLNQENIHEVKVNYNPRYKPEGKKISPLDGFPIIFNIIFYKFLYRQSPKRRLNET